MTPQPPAEALKRLTRLDETRKGGKQTKVAKHGFFPHRLRFEIPTPYPLEPCPFHSTLHGRIWLWFLVLFDVRIYMMSNYNVPYGMINHRQLSPLPKHTNNPIDGGAFALSSSPRLITLYTPKFIILLLMTKC